MNKESYIRELEQENQYLKNKIKIMQQEFNHIKQLLGLVAWEMPDQTLIINLLDYDTILQKELVVEKNYEQNSLMIKVK